jgi:MFS transporter, DHA2 family, methylenomycin A resistance protein
MNNNTHSSISKANWILLAVCILGIMIQIDYTAVNVALIAIGHSLNADLSTVQWALSAYVLAWGAFVITAGRCADLFGRRRTFLTGTLLFMLGSALTGAATQAWFMILGRVIQGMGGALFLPGLYTLIFTHFPEDKRGFALGILTSAFALGLAIGPTFGGVILHVLNWRWIFFLNLPLGIPVIAIILWAVEREPWRISDESMDYVGAFLVAVALVLLMYALNQVGVWGAGSPRFLITIALSIATMFLFIFYERRQAHPLLQLDMFKNQAFLGCSLTYIIMGFTFSTILIIGGLYLENVLKYSPLHTGFIFLIMTAMFALLSVFGGKLADRMDPRVPVILGSFATVAALFVFALCNTQSPLWMPMLALALFGIGGGLSFPALNATMMRSVPQNLLSTASSAYAMFGCVGNTIGLILSSLILVTFGQRNLGGLLTRQGWRLDAHQLEVLRNVVGSAHYNSAQLIHFPKQTITGLLDTLRETFVYGMAMDMWITIGLNILGIIISLLLIKGLSKTTPADAPQIHH